MGPWKVTLIHYMVLLTCLLGIVFLELCFILYSGNLLCIMLSCVIYHIMWVSIILLYPEMIIMVYSYIDITRRELHSFLMHNSNWKCIKQI